MIASDISWNHKDVWTHRERTFSVEVSRHLGGFGVDAPNSWCVYLHIYKNFPGFERFNLDGGMSDQPYFDVHSYQSLFKVNRDESNSVVSCTLGWDYCHDGDYDFATAATKDDAYRVFRDAVSLIKEAKEFADIAKATGEKE